MKMELPQAPDFTLNDQNGTPVTLSKCTADSPVLLVFYPGDFTPVCTAQLCNYRDNVASFSKFGLRILGISKNTPEEHRAFSGKYGFPFSLLSDPGNQVAKAYGCTSLWILGTVSRAIFVVGTQGQILYRHVEPTPITRRKADDLLDVLTDLKEKKLI